eukprot:scaffold34733_cov30-Attheya_sp.AAC.3
MVCLHWVCHVRGHALYFLHKIVPVPSYKSQIWVRVIFCVLINSATTIATQDGAQNKKLGVCLASLHLYRKTRIQTVVRMLRKMKQFPHFVLPKSKEKKRCRIGQIPAPKNRLTTQTMAIG